MENPHEKVYLGTSQYIQLLKNWNTLLAEWNILKISTLPLLSATALVSLF